MMMRSTKLFLPSRERPVEEGKKPRRSSIVSPRFFTASSKTGSGLKVEEIDGGGRSRRYKKSRGISDGERRRGGDGEEKKRKKMISPKKRKGKGDGLNVKSAVLKGMRLQTQLNKLGIPDNPIVPSMATSFSSSSSPVTSIISLPSTISSLSTFLSTSLPTSLPTPQIFSP